jgi:putative transposase
MVYGLNAMIDYAEKDLIIPIKKSVAPSSKRYSPGANLEDVRRPALQTVWEKPQAYY